MKSIRVCLWMSFAVGAVLSAVIAQVYSEDNSSAILILVNRRPSLDIYTMLHWGNETKHMICPNNGTYLVKENLCINNQYLFNGNVKCMCYN